MTGALPGACNVHEHNVLVLSLSNFFLQCLKHSECPTIITTQYAHASPLQDGSLALNFDHHPYPAPVFFSMPFEFAAVAPHFSEATRMPRLAVKVVSRDSWERYRVEVCSVLFHHMRLNLAPCEHNVQCFLVATSWCSFFLD